MYVCNGCLVLRVLSAFDLNMLSSGGFCLVRAAAVQPPDEQRQLLGWREGSSWWCVWRFSWRCEAGFCGGDGSYLQWFGVASAALMVGSPCAIGRENH